MTEHQGASTYGGAAKGMPRNWVVVPTTWPRKAPYGRATVGTVSSEALIFGIKRDAETSNKGNLRSIVIFVPL